MPPPSRDEHLLAELRAMWSRQDEVPAGLTDLITFALEVDSLNAGSDEWAGEVELLRLHRTDEREAVGARGQDGARIFTFTSAGVSLLLAVSPAERPDGADRLRIDGWVSPAGTAGVRVRSAAGVRAVVVDAGGRFVVPDVTRGPVQLALDAVNGEPGYLTSALVL